LKVEPNTIPKVPGYEKFKGPVMHTARWDDSIDLSNKNVLVLGTGCTAAQFVPKLTTERYNVASITQLMRTPPWIVPRPIPPGGEENWATMGPLLQTWVPGLARTFRWLAFWGMEAAWPMFEMGALGEKMRNANEKKLLARMKRIAPEKYHEILTPNYSLCCKRRIFDNTWYPSLHNPRLELTTLPLTSIQENSVTLGPGRHYPDEKDLNSKVSTEQKTVPVDVMILANGFQTQRWAHPISITGKNGADLLGTMDERGGPQAYQGTAMDGFPNFFVIFGPNTATGHSSVIYASECMTDYTMRLIAPILKGDVQTVDVKKEAEVAWTTDIQTKLKDTIFMKGGCVSWYARKDGWNSTVLP
jgi:cation diffusion facilitator CzcD-associated flavoprotein CzcO